MTSMSHHVVKNVVSAHDIEQFDLVGGDLPACHDCKQEARSEGSTVRLRLLTRDVYVCHHHYLMRIES